MEIPAAFDCRGAWTGAALSLAAAATFGIFAPAARTALARHGPIDAAGLTYLAAAAVALAAMAARRLAGAHPAGRRINFRDAPRLAGMTFAGGIAGPVLFFGGLQRLHAHEAAVLQHLEFGLTVIAAVIVLKERVGRRGILGLLMIGCGAALLPALQAARPGGPRGWDAIGAALIAAAAAAWATDNTLARGASDLDPLAVVGIKGGVAGATLLALAGGAGPLRIAELGPVLLAGGVGVGLSLVLELLALRRVGAALNAGLFTTGPAFGFVWSLIFLGERTNGAGWSALALCLWGAVALALDRHGHRHAHAPVVHTHAHHHPDGHHDHAHDAPVAPGTVHLHEHRHELLEHSHPHVHDDQHRHGHPSN
jgi:drug/metabolite transporter (DMT)-like permease